MDFSYTEDEQEFRMELRNWLETNLPEGWLDGTTTLPEDIEEQEEFLRDWQNTLFEGGWAGISWPEEYGGRGATLIEQSIYREEMARVQAPEPLNAIAFNFIGPTLIQVGTEEQKERFLSEMLRGEEIWCQGYSEPESGSDIASLRTRAERKNGEFVINGQKTWTSYARFADWCFVVTRTDDSGLKHEGLTVLLVDMSQEGVTTEPIHQISDDRGFNQVYFDDAVASDDMVVGEVDEGWDVVMTLSAFEHATTRIFRIESRYLDVLKYCRDHNRDGKPLVKIPHVRQKLADLDTRIQAAKVAHLRTLSKQMKTGIPGPEGSMDLVVGDEISIDLENLAMNVLGPEAALWRDGPEDGQWVHDYLQSYGLWIAAGTGDIQRNIIGERVLDLPKDIKSKESHKE